MGYVYLIEDEIQSLYKIGVTKNDPKIRVKKLQTGSPNKLKLIAQFETEYPFRLESMLHNRYDYCRVLNEWYDLPQNVIISFNEICQELNVIIIVMKDNPFFGKNLK
jgi:hypothetical protein